MWALDVDPLERHLVTGSADPEFRVFTISENEVSLGRLSAGPSQTLFV